MIQSLKLRIQESKLPKQSFGPLAPVLVLRYAFLLKNQTPCRHFPTLSTTSHALLASPIIEPHSLDSLTQNKCRGLKVSSSGLQILPRRKAKPSLIEWEGSCIVGPSTGLVIGSIDSWMALIPAIRPAGNDHGHVMSPLRAARFEGIRLVPALMATRRD